MYRTMKLVTGLLTLAVIICAPSTAASDHSARSLGMASSFQGNTGNCEAALLNPANLGWAQDHGWSIQLAAASLQVGNNAFGLADYNKYNGAYLSTADKEEILAKIPASGLDLHLAAQEQSHRWPGAKFAARNDKLFGVPNRVVAGVLGSKIDKTELIEALSGTLIPGEVGDYIFGQQGEICLVVERSPTNINSVAAAGSGLQSGEAASSRDAGQLSDCFGRQLIDTVVG